MKKDIVRMITKKTLGGPGGALGLCPTCRGSQGLPPGFPGVWDGVGASGRGSRDAQEGTESPQVLQGFPEALPEAP